MKLAFLFPGQGSQYVGMGKELMDSYKEAGDIFKRADEALGMELTKLCFEGPGDILQQTSNAQPAILTVSMACLAVLRLKGIHPLAAAGHSLGEYSALVCAGALNFEDTLQIVQKRGQYMQEAVPLGTGGMVAVLGLSAKTVIDVCERASEKGVVEAVNLNCPGQVVIAGENAALERACEIAKEAGAKRCIPLPVSAPFHSSLMKPAADKLSLVLDKAGVREPEIPVLSNVTADYSGAAPDIKGMLVEQVYSPVRWEECMLRLLQDGYDTFIEVGPGKVLSSLMKKISRDVTVYNFGDNESLEKILANLKEVG